MSSEVYYRSWMDKPHLDPNTNLLTEEYVQGIGEFMRLVQQQPDAKSGFSRNYKVWYLHGETGYEYGSTSEPQPVSEPQPDIRSSRFVKINSTVLLLYVCGRVETCCVRHGACPCDDALL
ncbi:hypothetical protein F2Q68_00029183 [Brassica cretica]|uniref:Uncharacterized protein n=1 Tax=Brassica cretica TaxID=69181 RepID=A0A8S9GFX1_BRACR|nr:hypothetical protein F2Q68_00029183 [Brassica cretica]